VIERVLADVSFRAPELAAEAKRRESCVCVCCAQPATRRAGMGRNDVWLSRSEWLELSQEGFGRSGTTFLILLTLPSVLQLLQSTAHLCCRPSGATCLHITPLHSRKVLVECVSPHISTSKNTQDRFCRATHTSQDNRASELVTTLTESQQEGSTSTLRGALPRIGHAASCPQAPMMR
jgi:hypothetical protein